MLLAAGEQIQKILIYIKEYLSIDSVWDVLRTVLDVAIVTYFFYRIMFVLRDSRAHQVIKGIIVVIVLSLIATLLRLTTVSYVIKAFVSVMPVLLVVLFQPEIRRWLENLGNGGIKGIFTIAGSSQNDNIIALINEVANAVTAMARERVGALIVFERSTNLGEIVRTGTVVDATVSEQLLRLIFIPNTPLHDGAVVIRDERIRAAACYLPNSSSNELDKDLGTRHRAGVGVTENTDCVSVIVSEETGYISIAEAGVLTRNISREKLVQLLKEALCSTEKKARTRKSGKTDRKQR